MDLYGLSAILTSHLSLPPPVRHRPPPLTPNSDRPPVAMAAANASIAMREALTLTSLGIAPQFVTFTHVTMESEKYICVRETSPQNSIVIIDMAMPMQPLRCPITADSALMNPDTRILALKAQMPGTTQDHLQIFNIVANTKIKSHQMPEQVVFWKWITPKLLGLVTQTSVFHWSMEGDSEPTKMFDRTANLANNQIINYQCDPAEKWLVLIGTAPGIPERPQLVKGNMQLFSVDQQSSQAHEAHAASFATFKVVGNKNPSTLVCFASKTTNAGQITSKLHAIELRTQPGKPGFSKKQADLLFPPDFHDDFPIAMQVSQKYGLIYVITKLGLLFLYDLETATAVYRNRISRDPIFLTTESSSTGGFYAINRRGQVLHATVNDATLLPSVSGQLNNYELAVTLAKRANLPGAENLVVQRFQKLFAQTKCKEADELDAESPRDPLRIDELNEDFLPWIDQASSSLVPLLWSYSCKEVQRAAIAALPRLLLSAKMAIEKAEAQGRYESYVTKLSNSIIPALVKAVEGAPETELRASMVDSLNDCMQIALSGANLRVEIVVAIFGPLPVDAFLKLRNALNVLHKENRVQSDAYQIASSALMEVIQWHRDSIRSYELENQLSRSRRAFWELYDNWIFCKICIEEMERGCTFPQAFLEDFSEMFFTRTGKILRRDQFVNKWKGLKKMYTKGTKDKDFITQYPLYVELPGLLGLVIKLFKNCDNKIESCDGRDGVSEQAKLDPPPLNIHSSCLDENSIINTLEDKIKILELSNEEKERSLEDMKSYLAHMEAKLAEKDKMLVEAELLRKRLHNQMMDLKGHMRVFCRVRPSFGNGKIMVNYPTSLEHAGRGIQLMRKDKMVLYTYDKVFDHTASQEVIFKDISELVQSAIDGYKVTIFSYGQTGSGKTYTMIGKPDADQEGIIPRALEEIFRYKRTWEDNGWTFDVKASMFQLYNEKFFDLLDMSSKKHCDIYTDRGGNVVVSNLDERLICNEADAAFLFKEASKHRFVDKTQMNEESSRSHFVFKLMISGYHKQLGQKVEGVLQMIDLAGSETASKIDEIPDKRRNETKNINMSLLALGNLFEAIGGDDFMPYRRSKLTHLLQNFFVGDCKILMFVNISPEPSSIGATLSSLDFAAKVHNCKIKRQSPKSPVSRRPGSCSRSEKWKSPA